MNAAHESRQTSPERPTRRVIILGGGFGGVYAALELEKMLAGADDLEPARAQAGAS